MALQNLLGELALESKQDEQLEVLEEIEHAIQSIASTRGVSGDLRVTILGGGVTISSGTVTTVSTVTTVNTVTALTNIGGIPATQLVPSNQNLIATIANINNIGV